MSMKVMEKNGVVFVEGLKNVQIIAAESDALEVLGYCGQYRTQRVMLHKDNLSDDFFNLRTCLAGFVLQKFMNYQVKAAAVLPPELEHNDRFKEMVLETNTSTQFRVFTSREEAEKWLIQ